MKLLEKEFVSSMGGQNPPLTYKQVCRQGLIAVYERSLENKIRDYEVIIIRLAKAGDEVFNKIYDEDQEFYPGSSLWGKTGFSYHGPKGKESAIYKFNKLLNEQNQDKSAPEIKKEMIIPKGEFTVGELAELNKVNYITASNFVKQNKFNSIVFVREEKRASRGKMSKIYKEISL